MSRLCCDNVKLVQARFLRRLLPFCLAFITWYLQPYAHEAVAIQVSPAAPDRHILERAFSLRSVLFGIDDVLEVLGNSCCALAR